MRLTHLFASLALTATLVGCTSEIDNKPAAAVSDAKPADKTAAKDAKPGPPPPPPAAPVQGATNAAVPAGAWGLAADSQIDWVGAKVTNDHKGGFKTLSGHATVADGKLTGATVTITLESLFADHPKLEKHLKSADFFDVATHPSATFTLTSVVDGTATGTLDLHGVKKELKFPATVEVTGTDAKVSAEFTLLRKDFGIVYPGKPEDLIRDEVLVKGTLHFKS